MGIERSRRGMSSLSLFSYMSDFMERLIHCTLQLMNEEGLPVFDIREEISDDVVEPARSSVVPVSADPNSKPRYLTQEKGRQTFGTLFFACSCLKRNPVLL